MTSQQPTPQLLVGETDRHGPVAPRLDRHDAHRFRAPRFVDSNDRRTQLDRLVAIGVADIRVHLERVTANADARDPAGTYGALVDLFIATGPSAAEVRRRAQYWGRGVLSRDQERTLDRHVETGIDPFKPLLPRPDCILWAGVTGTTDLVGAGHSPRSLGSLR